MQAIAGPIDLIIRVAVFIMIIQIIMSWLVTFDILNTRQPLVAQLYYGLGRLLEPVYRPVRRLLPETGGLDLAPLVVFIILISLRLYIFPAILCGGRPLTMCG